MQKVFTEFENENALRVYPFASGCTTKDTSGSSIGTGILIDAALYPVNSRGPLYLSKIGVDGVVSISDSDSVVMTATIEKNSTSLIFYDMTGMHRHVGTLLASSTDALTTLVNVYDDRIFEQSETMFASSCVFPITNSGVLSLNVGGIGELDGTIKFKNASTDQIRVSTDAAGSKLRFDVIPIAKKVILSSIQHIYCIVDGKTPFRINKMPFAGGSEGNGNTIAVYLDNITRQDVCNGHNRADSLEMKDTCDCGSSDPCDTFEQPVDIPDTYQVEVVDIPNEADSSFYLAVPNMTGYDNPLSITLTEGATEPITEVKVDANADNTKNIKNNIKSKGVILQVPGVG